MRKKILALLLAATMIFGVAACGKTPDNPDNPDNPDKPKPAETVYEAATMSPDYATISDETLATYTTYYFDNQKGIDAATGLDDEKPKKSLDEAMNIIKNVKAGVPTRILFKAGSEWTGSLAIEGFEAAEETPLLVGVYGATDEEQYAKIKDGTRLITVKGSNVRVSGFDLSGPKKSKKGITFFTSGSGATKNVVISGNYIHDINYDWAAYQEWLADPLRDQYADERGKLPHEMSDETTICRNPKIVTSDNEFGYGNGGIFTESGTNSMQGASWFEDCWVENNIITRVARSGMFLDAGWYYKPGHNWGSGKWYQDENGVEHNVYPNKNMIVRGNNISYVGGDSIVLLATDGGWIENNVSYHANYVGRGGYYNAGIWPHSCKNIVMQYNEAAYTHLDNGAGDGQGFDIDIGCSNITFQYNYSHHNKGGGLLLANAGSSQPIYDVNGNPVRDEDNIPVVEKLNPYWGDNVLRNNVFADNVNFIKFDGALTSLEIYNNTFISSAVASTQSLISSHDPYSAGGGQSWVFRNNIFLLRNKVTPKIETNNTRYAAFENNVFWNFGDGFNANSKDYMKNPKNNVILDPQITTEEAKKGYENAKLFVSGNDGVFTAGAKLEKANKTDFNGNNVEGILYAGAFGKK